MHRRQEKIKERGDHSRLAGGSFNKQGNLHKRLVLGGCKISGSLRLPTRILEVRIEALTGFSLVFSPDGLNNTLFSQGLVLEIAHTFQGQERG